MLASPTHPFARLDTLRHHALARPLMAALLLVAGGLALYAVAALVDRRDAAATFVPEGASGPLGQAGVPVLTLPLPDRAAASPPAASPPRGLEGVADLEVALARLKTAAAAIDALDSATATGADRLVIDAAAPPLRIEIMGLADTSWTSLKPSP